MSINSIEAVKAEAARLGLVFSPNIGIETLRERVRAEKVAREEAANSINNETSVQRANRLRKHANQMFRVEVTCLNNARAKEQGVWIIGGNGVVGTVRELVPVGVPWHITRITRNVIKEKMFSKQRAGKAGERGERVLSPEYQIDILPDLSVEDLARLARAQEANRKLAED